MLEKARSLPADEVVIDLEDSVAPDLKTGARATTVGALREGGFPGLVAVRVNALSSEWGAEDVDAVAGLADSLVLPKVEAPEDPGVPFQALIETAVGLARAVEIASRSTGLESLIIGFADLAASLGREIDSDWSHARETVLGPPAPRVCRRSTGPITRSRTSRAFARTPPAPARSAWMASGPCIPRRSRR